MKAPLKWLNDFTDLTQIAHRELCDKLTMSGSKVENFVITGSDIKNVVTGRIDSIEPHPDADKLVVCQLDVAQEELVQIVTGASNVSVGDIVPVALHKSQLPGGVKITKGKLRGVVSNGMLCSIHELGLTKDDYPEAADDGIFLLPKETAPGLPIQDVLGMGDCVIEFEITSNRPDCFSMEGLGREAAITLDQPFKPVQPAVKAEGSVRTADYMDIAIEAPDLCSRYTGRVVTDVKIEPSPSWLRHRLRDAGVRPINNIVDITNYVMLELGQPMHAFDLSRLSEGKLRVRRAAPGETITTLDDNEHQLTSDTLVIADAKDPIALAGVMGGKDTEIEDHTTAILFESAVFDAVSVRRTAQRVGLRTESSSRFEKSLDPENSLRALDRACELVELLGCGKVAPDYIDCRGNAREPRVIRLRPDKINSFLGTDIKAAWMAALLEEIGCTRLNEDGDYRMPSFRPDLESEADLAEEVARFYGYNNIPSTLLKGKETVPGGLTKDQRVIEQLKDIALGAGYYEVCTYSFGNPQVSDQLCLPADSPLRHHVVLRESGVEYSVMRTSMLPSLLTVAAGNYNRGIGRAKLFEIGYVYRPVSEDPNVLPHEIRMLTAVSYEQERKGSATDLFYRAKGLAEEIATDLGLPELDFHPLNDHPSLHPYRSASVLMNGEVIGFVGVIHPAVARNFETASDLVVLNLELDKVLELATFARSQKKLPKYPAVTRDLAVVVDEKTLAGELRACIKKNCNSCLECCEFFDVYTGAQVGEGKKSIAFSLTFRSPDGTMTDDEVNALMKKILEKLESETGAKLR